MVSACSTRSPSARRAPTRFSRPGPTSRRALVVARAATPAVCDAERRFKHFRRTTGSLGPTAPLFCCMGPTLAPVSKPTCLCSTGPGTHTAQLRISAIADTRFMLIADGVQRVRVPGLIVSQVSSMAVKPTVLSTLARSAGVGNAAPKAMLG